MNKQKYGFYSKFPSVNLKLLLFSPAVGAAGSGSVSLVLVPLVPSGLSLSPRPRPALPSPSLEWIDEVSALKYSPPTTTPLQKAAQSFSKIIIR